MYLIRRLPDLRSSRRPRSINSRSIFLPAKKAKLENNLFQSRHPAFVIVPVRNEWAAPLTLNIALQALQRRKVGIRWRHICVVVDCCLNQCRSIADPPCGLKGRTHFLRSGAGEPGTSAGFREASEVDRLQLGSKRGNA